MKFKQKKGNIIDVLVSGDVDAIAHGCNCFHVMGNGVARYLDDFLEGSLIEADRRTPYGDINKLGTFSKLEINLPESFGKTVTVYNVYTQHTYGESRFNDKKPVLVHWASVKRGLLAAIRDMGDRGKIAIPAIGCGLANGQLDELLAVIDELSDVVSDDVELTLIIL